MVLIIYYEKFKSEYDTINKLLTLLKKVKQKVKKSLRGLKQKKI